MRPGSALMRFLAAFVVLALASSQVAIAAYAPPASLPSMQATMAATEDCHESPAVTPLCKKTCQGEPQKHDVPELVVLPPDTAAFLRVDVAFPARGTAVPLAPVPARATSPPPLVLFSHYLK